MTTCIRASKSPLAITITRSDDIQAQVRDFCRPLMEEAGNLIEPESFIYEVLHKSTLDRIEALEDALRDCAQWMEVAQDTPEVANSPEWQRSIERVEQLLNMPKFL